LSLLRKLFSINNNKQTINKADFSEGDIFYIHIDNQYHIYKLLFFEKDFECYHVLSYEPLSVLPSEKDIDTLNIQIYHSPVDKNGFKGAALLANRTITSEDLIGYHEYLRQTRPIEEYFPLANGYYLNGLRLTDEKKHKEAIDSYSKAADLVPSFFEAIDNRAFCKMDLGLWLEAIEDFRQSLSIHPGSLLAEFSIGECYFKTGDYAQAKHQFERANTLDPNAEAPKNFLKRVNAKLGIV